MLLPSDSCGESSGERGERAEWGTRRHLPPRPGS